MFRIYIIITALENQSVNAHHIFLENQLIIKIMCKARGLKM